MHSLILQTGWKAFDTRIADERLSSILWFLGIVLFTLLLKKPLAALFSKISCRIIDRFGSRNDAAKFQELTRKPFELLLQTFLFYIAVSQLSVFLSRFVMQHKEGYNLLNNIRVGDIVNLVFLFLLILFTTLAVSRVLDFIFHIQIEKAYEQHEKEKQQLLPLVKEVAKIIVWSLGVFWVLGSVFKVNIPALITGLGIGGVAIALAAKESVENFFAAFTILTDKPFQTGDAVKLGSLEGTVERIGFRSTRLRNGDGSLFIIPNKKLIGENLENLSDRDTRKVKLVLTLKYVLSESELARLMDDLKTMVSATLHVNEPVVIVPENFGENAFQLSISYFLPEPMAEGARVEAVKQEITLRSYGIVSKYLIAAPLVATPPVETKEDNQVQEDNGGEESAI